MKNIYNQKSLRILSKCLLISDPNKEMFSNLGGSIALTRLMEIIIQVSGSCEEKMEKIYNHFYKKLFKNQLAELAVHPQANFR